MNSQQQEPQDTTPKTSPVEGAPKTYALIPIRSAAVFPGISLPISVGRAKSLAAFRKAEAEGREVVVTCQTDPQNEDPAAAGLFKTATLCRIETAQTNERGRVQVVITGTERFVIDKFVSEDPCFLVQGHTVPDVPVEDPVRSAALIKQMKEIGKEILTLLPANNPQLVEMLDQIEDLTYLANFAASYLNLNLSQKQELLEEPSVAARVDKLLEFMIKEREVLSIQKGINSKLSQRFNKAQKDAVLREQIKAIREELGDEESSTKDKLRERIEEAGLPEAALKIAMTELRRLEDMPAASAEYHVIRTYLDWLAEMPWSKSSDDRIDLTEARQILDADHYGLEHVKKRIVQFLAVAKLKNDLRGPILCLVGPPGVGKTSLGQSIAKALGRKFIRTSLGGVRDEAEIRGHRRTYVGAMPGRISQSLKRVGVNNPVMLLDEVDKLMAGYQGDPSSALLEVLDPEQNGTFTDHYLDTPFDLSKVFFVATANVPDQIPAPLRDRMEIIDISGYTGLEKLHIAKNHLLPKQITDHGLKAEQIEVTDEAIRVVVANYTREAGVRELQRKLASLCRAAAEDIVGRSTEDVTKVLIDEKRVAEILGAPRYLPESSERISQPGIVTGLAWTPVGGDILFVEASSMPGTGKLTLTGQLGDVMKESAQLALSFLRSQRGGLCAGFDFEKRDIHVHVPAGAIPKDGPSAGITMLTALASLTSGRIVTPKLAMTGETTLRGAVLPVGGIKEKVLAAHRAGVKQVILPKRNEPDLRDVPANVKDELSFHFVESAQQVLEIAMGSGAWIDTPVTPGAGDSPQHGPNLCSR